MTNLKLTNYSHKKKSQALELARFAKQRTVPMTFGAPALLFPYIRAYVSNITALSGMQPIIMPTLNMVAVGEELVSQLDLS